MRLQADGAGHAALLVQAEAGAPMKALAFVIVLSAFIVVWGLAVAWSET